MSWHDDFLFRGALGDLDPAVAQLVELEKERQARKLIMISSESSSPWAVREALSSVLMNIYAEGYPNPETHWLAEDEILDYEHHLAYYRRYGDRRYYRGVEYADVIESLARRRCAEAFATADISADQIYVNVQPLSGAPANVAVQQALLKPGDTIMGMALSHGGHLTHGSPVNISGRLYNVISYHVDERTELLDYDEIAELAEEHRPRLIIAGYTSYPRLPNWAMFRRIADRVGAYLLADIAHVAGMVIAGAFPTPLGYADVISFTTHKTLCGPRGACILTTNPILAQKIDHMVFPGLQGGPHVNKFAAMAVAFRLAQTEQFRQLQHQTVANAAALAQALTAQGLRVPCGGTESHLLLLDCKTIHGRDDTPLMGDVTAAVLDLIGIVVNKNTIPGDRTAAYPSGIRLGTPWVTQRGLREPEMERIAHIIARAMNSIEPFTYTGVRGPIYRGKVDFDMLEDLRVEVAELADQAGIDFELPCSGYPHHCLVPDLRPREEAYSLIEVVGNLAAAFIEQVTPTDVADLKQGEWQPVALLERDGRVMSMAQIQRPGFRYHRYWLALPADRARRVIAWLRNLSDGYVRFDDKDLWAKLPGPVVVRDLGGGQDLPAAATWSDIGEMDSFTPPLSHKPYFIGLSTDGYTDPPGEPLPSFEWQELESEEGDSALRRTSLYTWHVQHGAKMAPFAGWEMPLWYTAISDEHRAVRGAAGLFDVSHMGVFDVSGPHAAYFLNLVTTNDVNTLRPGESQYSYFLTPDGRVIDDLMVYMLEPARYLLVVNAANADKDWAWLQAVNEREVRLDDQRPWARTSFRAELRNLHEMTESYAWLTEVALQGPRSRDILLALLDAAPHSGAVAEIRGRLKAMKRTEVLEAQIPSRRASGGVLDLIIARTGYTGEPQSFELFVHPEALVILWERLLEVGEPFGLRPIGLGARDSLRIEAGLPLYGHELAGPLDLRPDDAGFAGYIKLNQPFFVGRRAYIEHAQERKMVVVRFHIEEKGVRVPKQGDVVTDSRGRVIGQVTSCAMDTEGYLVGQAYVDLRHAEEGAPIRIFPRPVREVWDKPYEELEVGDRLVMHNEAVVVSRFMKPRRRASRPSS
ncbi:MAG TPA: glycine cleavage system aminomethyltransferase GcvT [Chloroflexi bacterium]|nr:glycine cleavage system aminomethyltransferase GcvT [Chloroflexota bacterium]